MIVAITLGTCVQYTISLGEIIAPFTSSLPAAPAIAAAVPFLADPRRLAIALASVPILVGLLSFRDMKALRSTSMVGTSALVVSTLLVVLRALDGSYAPGGRFFAALAGGARGAGMHAAPAAASAWELSASSIGLVGAMNTAFMSHVDIPRYYSELKDASTRRLGGVAAGAFVAASAMYGAIIVAARHTFGGSMSDFLLTSYASSDTLATVAQLMTALGVGCSYLLTMLALKGAVAESPVGSAVRESVGPLSRPGGPDARPCHRTEREATDRALSVLLFAVITALAFCGASKLLLVVALRGTILCTAMIYIIPAAIALVTENKAGKRPGKVWTLALRGLIGWGFVSMVIGTTKVLTG